MQYIKPHKCIDITPKRPAKSLDLKELLRCKTVPEIKIANTKPIKYIFNEKEKRVSSWVELYTNIIKELVNNNKEMIYSFIYDKDFNATTKMFSKNKDGLRNSAKINDDLYCETNLNTSRKIKILKEIFETLEIEPTSLLVYVVPN